MRLPLAKSMTAARSFLLHDQRNTAWLRLPDCRVDGHAPASAARVSSVGNRSRQSPISASRVAARMIPDLGVAGICRVSGLLWAGVCVPAESAVLIEQSERRGCGFHDVGGLEVLRVR